MLRVLLVDDSSFMRKELASILEYDHSISVIATAVDGIDAVKKSFDIKPDVIVMDIEMPNMDGIEAVKKILTSQSVPILLLSGANKAGAARVLDGLHSGAADFLPKQLDSQSDILEFGIKLRSRVCSLARDKTAVSAKQGTQSVLKNTALQLGRLSRHDYQIIAIAASTGGPVAVEKVLMNLPENFPLPIVIIQHMPASFTEAFAERLNSICKITVHHAQENQMLQAGQAYVAPGGKQMTIVKKRTQSFIRISLVQGQQYNPCVDITFQSIAEQFQSHALAIVLTGMGRDGLQGGQALKQQGASLWAQDKETSVIYGMPMAIAENNLADKILPLDAIASELVAA